MFSFISIPVAALASMVIGFIWYNPKVMGTVWMKSAGITDPEKHSEGANMAVIFGLSIFFACLLALALLPMTVHQTAIGSLVQDMNLAKDAKIELLVNGESIAYGDKFRTFKHGAFHGTIMGILVALPILGTNALYERRGFKYIAVNAGYWIICMAVMGGIICGWPTN